jgi:hypothetical protein
VALSVVNPRLVENWPYPADDVEVLNKSSEKRFSSDVPGVTPLRLMQRLAREMSRTNWLDRAARRSFSRVDATVDISVAAQEVTGE